MLPRLNIDRDKLTTFCHKWHIKRLWLFGSILRDDFGDDSDVDILVEFKSGQTPGLRFIDIQEALSELFHGHQADLILEEDLHPRIRNHPYFQSEVLYAER